MKPLAAIPIALSLLLACPAAAADKSPKAKATAKPKAKAPNPAFATVEDVAGLPRVLLIGDSISIGYTGNVRRMLEGKANLHRIPENGGPTINGLAKLDKWLGTKKWDVIHFNWGLHDLKFMGADGSNLAKPDAPGSHQQVVLADYERNLDQLVTRMKQTGARLIWCATTPVPSGAQGRIPGSEKPYNEAALRVMKKHGIAVNDLNSWAASGPAGMQLPANVHYSSDGSEYLAKQVVASIESALALK